MTELEVDVLIVGARVAGALLATRLGVLGWNVLVVDRSSFPSPTLSTHFFRGSGCAGALRDVGVLDDVLATGPPRLVTEYNADALDGTSSQDEPQDPGDLGFNLSVRRTTLDATLVERARREATVAVKEETSLRDLRVERGRVVGAVVSEGEATRSIRSRIVVGADGHASRVASLVGAETQERIPPSRAMYYRYASGMEGPNGDPDGPEFSLGDDELIYAFPSDEGFTCVAISVNLASYRAMRRDAEHAFPERVLAHPFLAPRVTDVAWDGRLMGCGPRDAVIRVPAGPGWALVGDASMHQDPWTGLGMDNAAVHAGLLGEAIDDILSGRAGEASALARYHGSRDEHALGSFHETAEIGRDLNVFRQT